MSSSSKVDGLSLSNQNEALNNSREGAVRGSVETSFREPAIRLESQHQCQQNEAPTVIGKIKLFHVCTSRG